MVLTMTKLHGCSLLLFCLLTCSGWLHARQIYDLADLEILRDQKNYPEFFAHARDIRPVKRGKLWNEMVQTMAADYIDQQIRFKNYEAKTAQMVEQIATWPLLKADEFFQVKRNRFQRYALSACLKKRNQNKTCQQKALTFWDRSIKDPETGYRIAEIFASYIPDMKLWPILSTIGLHPQSVFYCNKKIVIEQAIRHFSDTLEVNSSAKIIKKTIDQSLNSGCWQAMIPSFKQFIETGPESYRTLVFRLLHAKSSLKQDESDRFLVKYLLDDPGPGHVFNQSWQIISEMGEDPLRRAKLMSYLKQQDPLLGNIFGPQDPKRSKAVAKLLSENFSEYLIYYAKTCVSYFEGKRHFPFGNPTLHCDHLMRIKNADKWIGQTLHSRYLTIKKKNSL